ncbi:hypothetical protein [Synechococcus sp. M16CYN]|uniref:hypothetical protein n=1 Tax=Synechococcus sp. M16CYN TaxID=3103139 RepID=UPI0030DE1C0B
MAALISINLANVAATEINFHKELPDTQRNLLNLDQDSPICVNKPLLITINTVTEVNAIRFAFAS